jgi:hypothetical protein
VNTGQSVAALLTQSVINGGSAILGVNSQIMLAKVTVWGYDRDDFLKGERDVY